MVKVEVGFFHSASDDVVITLDDGRIVHVSQEFNAVNLFKNRKDFDEFHVGDVTSFEIHPTY